ncbi:contact-dependent growth inhibition system immunity protein [Actinomadura rudentiformis]|uniref:contact-dependent growth inhibition system immunity protein n=1 Tax=Actinomadura rudentiformis TaxID=359158 RepID=UPI00178C81DE
MYKELKYLAQAYFHQDYDLEASSPIGAIHNFVRDEPREIRVVLAAEVEALLASSPEASQFRALWVDEWAAAYAPSADTEAWRAWFEDVLRILTQ